MSYTIEHLPKHAAILTTFAKDFSVSTELASCFTALATELDKTQTPLTVILDMLQYSLSVDALIEGTKIVLTGDNPIRHAKTKRFVAVTHSSLIALSLDGFRKIGIGDVKTDTSVEEVLKTL
jgi:hypothetical protein